VLRDGLDRPDEGVGEVLPLSEAVVFSVFSIALAAVTLAPASGTSFLTSSFLAAGGAVVAPMVRTLAFGLGASPPMLSTFGAPSFVVTGLFNSADPDEPSVGRFAIVGVGLGGCCEDAACGC